MPSRLMNRFALVTLLTLWVVIGPACTGASQFGWSDDEPSPTADPASTSAVLSRTQLAETQSLAFRDTIAAMTYLDGRRMMRVQGYGIVAGLGEKGSSECPKNIRDLLIGQMEKRYAIGLPSGLSALAPEDLIDSRDTAVVRVVGEMPAAATKGTRFDIEVSTLPRSQTVSLAGGRLYTCDLNLVGSVGSGPARRGKLLARAFGPIFVNPFNDDEKGGPIATGRVLGGGVTLEPRRLRLKLVDGSYERAYRITDRINERFGHDPDTAEAISPYAIQLRVPDAYQGRGPEFLDLLQHLYLNPDESFASKRATLLAREILEPDAPHLRISLAWECMGRTVLPTVQSLYTHPRPHARFFAARTGLRLGDELAVDVLASFAKDMQSEFAKPAITVLGESEPMFQATDALKVLLDHEDPRVRVAAYEAIRGRYGSGITSKKVGTDNFTLDVVVSRGPGLIYARQEAEARLAIFGPDLACTPPVFYAHPDRVVLINADETDTHLTVVRRTRFHNLVSPSMPVSFAVADLVRKLGDDPTGDTDEERGLALSYDQVLRILHTFCTKETVIAKFIFDSPSITDVFGPIKPQGRPETDL
jgi:flagellar basal body P-ring protein FlgI